MKSALCLLCLLAPPALAKDFDGADWAWSIAAGVGGGAVGGLAAGAIGVASVEPEDDFGFARLAAAAVALPIGIDLGASGAVFAYGELTDHDGSYLATLAGSTVGTLVGIGFFVGMVRIDDSLSWLGLVGLLGAPAVGATVGYRLSLEDEAPPSRERVGRGCWALVDYHPEAGLRLSVPAVRASLAGDGLVVGLPVLGGRF